MLFRTPGLVLTDDLSLRIGGSEMRLTAADGFRLAETLLRGATRRAIHEEAADAPKAPASSPRVRRKAAA